MNVSQTSLSRTPEGDETVVHHDCTNNTNQRKTNDDNSGDIKCASNGTLDSNNNNNSNNNQNNNETPTGNGSSQQQQRQRNKSGNKSSMRRMSLFQLSTNPGPGSSNSSNGNVSKKNSTSSITASPAMQNRFESIRLYANLDSNSMFEPINLETGVEKFNQNVKKIKKNKKCRALNVRRHTHYYYSTLTDNSLSIGSSGDGNGSGRHDSSYTGNEDDEKHSGNLKRFMAKKVSDTWHSAVRVKRNFLDSLSSWNKNSATSNNSAISGQNSNFT